MKSKSSMGRRGGDMVGRELGRRRERVYLKNECTRLGLLLHSLTPTATHILSSVPSCVERCVRLYSHSPRPPPHSELPLDPAPFPKRSHNCGSLTSGHVGSRVVLAGWLLPER